MMKLIAYTVDEWRQNIMVTSDKDLGQYFGTSATTIQHYRKNDVLIAETDDGFRRVSNFRGK